MAGDFLSPEEFERGRWNAPKLDLQALGSLPPDVIRYIMSNPSYAEGERPSPLQQYTPVNPYRGMGLDPVSPWPGDPRSDDWIQRLMQEKRANQQQNFPTWEQNTPGMDDNLGFTLLPSGQYLPSNNPHLLGYFMGQQRDHRQSQMDMMSLLMQMMPQGSGGP